MIDEQRDGARFAQALHMAARHIEVCHACPDGLNVLPTPAGDTGANLAHTLRGSAAALPSSGTLGAVAQAPADGARRHGRGNPGIILARALCGLARSRARAPTADAAGLRAAIPAASPVDGTILSGIRLARRGAPAARRHRTPSRRTAHRDARRWPGGAALSPRHRMSDQSSKDGSCVTHQDRH